MEWFMKRNNYVKSVATNSMTGFVLGIGDRHAHNILIDQISGECVHIDFGIVFDQGKGLGTPETVPFRLTRDIVDGMGVNGIEGPFRRCSEEVLRVLRENSFNLLTILEVVIYDPLYKWSLSPLKARNKQMVDNANANETGVNNQDNGKVNNDQVPDFHENILQRRRNVRNTAANVNNPGNDTTTSKAPQTNFGKDAAERTLMKIRNKLRGYEDLSFDALDVPGHVDMLINEAKDPSNLCKIFPGWAPWL
jgi:ataxia telangiectasia mutated family protein